jgi:hypothetical protein
MRAAGQATKDNSRIYLSLVLFFATIVAVSGLWIQPFSVGGDVAAKWRFVRYMVDPSWTLISFDHQTARWALNLPASVFAAVFGVQASTVFLIPTLAFAGLCCMLLMSWRRMFTWPVTFLLMVAVALNPMNVWLHSEFLPDNVSILYVWAAFALLMGNQRNSHIWSAIVLFLAYGAKITNVFFVPGVLVWLCCARGVRPAIVYAAALGLLFVAESIVTSLILGKFLPLGLVQASLSTHLAGMETTYVYDGWWDTIARWKLDIGAFTYAKIIMLLFILAAALTAIVRLRRPVSMPAPVSLCLCMGVSFAFFISFAAISIAPFRPVQPLIDRYLWPLFPFALTYLGWLLESFAGGFLRRFRILPQSDFAWILATATAFCLALAASSYLYLQYKRLAHRNGIAYPFTLYSIDRYFERMKVSIEQCRAGVFYHSKTIGALDTILTPVGGPMWSKSISVERIPRQEFLRRFAPELIGTTDEHAGTSDYVFVASGEHCGSPDLCTARVYGALEYDLPVKCHATFVGPTPRP